jgi:hypothetical protein
MSKANKDGKEIVGSSAYATPADFRHIFTEDINNLYLLSLLLTGDPEKAERCFVEGVEESTRTKHVFKEWARSWARRTIIQCAIRLVGPREGTARDTRTADFARAADKVPMHLHAEICAILGLAFLERFVFVMSALERYSDNDCSILLGLTRRDIGEARVRAIKQLGTLLGSERDSQAFGSENTSAFENTDFGLMITQRFATAAWGTGVP